MTDRTQPEALRLALSISLMDTFTNYQQEELDKAAAELRRQHARIAELEAQLEAIGAGGVSGPLMGKPQAMPSWMQYDERTDVLTIHGKRYAAGMFGEVGFLSPPGTWLRVCVGSEDCVTLTRASAAASAGSEPVARVNDDGFIVEIGDLAIAPGQKLYLHPAPPEGMVGGWIALPGTLPEPGTPVLLDIGKKYPIRAMWAAKFTLLVSLEDDSGFGEHDERTDEWYCPEGWYEWNEHEETHWRVTEAPRAWAPLQPTTSAGSGKGE